MKPYLETLKSVNETGKLYGDRTGTGRYRQFGRIARESAFG